MVGSYNMEILMKKVLFLLTLLISTPVYAQENSVLDTAKAVIDALEPKVDNVYFLNSSALDEGEWVTGFSASLYNFTKDEKKLASWRIGYVPDSSNRFYTGLEADLKEISLKVIPPEIKDVATIGYLETFGNIADKYTTLGAMLGYDIEKEDLIWGPTFSVKITF